MRAGQLTGGRPVSLRLILGDPKTPCSEETCVVKASAVCVELKRSDDWVCVGLPGKGQLGLPQIPRTG